MLLLAIVALGVPLAINLRARVNAEIRTQALAQADLVAATAADMLARGDQTEMATLAHSAAGSLGGRILIVNRTGGVLMDSNGPAQLGSSYESRPEIQAALAGRQTQAQRYSNTLHQEILATAVPIIGRLGRPLGAVRVTQSVASVRGAVNRAEFGLILIGLIVLTLGLIAGVVIAAQVGRPIARLEHVAQQVTRGDLSARALVEGSREQRSLAGSFNEMTERITRLLSAQRAFVADASHQLRTPLTGLRLRIEEAKALSPSAQAVTELDAALAEVDRLARTVDELLTLSQLDEGARAQASGRVAGVAARPAGAVAPVAAPVQPDELAAAAAARWGPLAGDRDIALELRAEAGDAPVLAAAADVERALDALAENAIKYSPDGSTVTLVSRPDRLEVRDRGPGIAAEERESVFERFHRGRAGLAGPTGSGLGLPIARDLARGWGGDIRLEAREGGGLVAIVWLPASMPGPVLPAVNHKLGSFSSG